MKIKKLLTKNKKTILASLIATSTIISITTGSILITQNNIKNINESLPKSQDDEYASDVLSEENKTLKEVTKNSNPTSRKQIFVDLNQPNGSTLESKVQNAWDGSMNTELNIRNANGSTIKVIEHNDSSLSLEISHGFKIAVSNPDQINSKNFEISYRNYNSSPYGIDGNQFIQNKKQDKVIVPWSINQVNNFDPNEYPLSPLNQIIFDSTRVNIIGSGGMKGNGSNYISELTFAFRTNDFNYQGPDRIDAITHTSFGGNEIAGSLNSEQTLKAVVVPDYFKFNTGDPRIFIPDFFGKPIENLTTYYEPQLSVISPSESVTPSQFIQNFSSRIPINVYNQFRGISDRDDLNPKAYLFGNDEQGTVTVVITYPYGFRVSKNGIEVIDIKPTIKTFSGFKKTIGNDYSKRRDIYTYEMSKFINWANNYQYKNNQATRLNNPLTPFIYFKIMIDGGLIKFSRVNESELPLEPGSDENSIIESVFNGPKYNVDWNLNGNEGAIANAPYVWITNDSIDRIDASIESRKGSSQGSWEEFTDYFLTSYGYKARMVVCSSYGISNNQILTPLDIIYTPKGGGRTKFLGPDYGYQNLRFFNHYFDLSKNYRDEHGFHQPDGVNRVFNRTIPFVDAIDSNNPYLRMRQLSIVPLPLINGPVIDMVEYYNSYIKRGSRIKLEVDGKLEQWNDSIFSLGKNAALPAGQLFLYNSADKNTSIIKPTLFDTTNVIIWRNHNLETRLSYETPTIFSSHKNLVHNVVDIGVNNSNFGKTHVSGIEGIKNYGVTGNESILPSQWIQTDAVKNVQFQMWNSLTANQESTKVSFIPNDASGTVTVEVRPFFKTEIFNKNDPDIMALNTLNDFDNLDASDFLKLSNTKLIHDDVPITFEITGFKKNENQSAGLEDNFFNPTSIMITNFSISGPDIESNYRVIGRENHDTINLFNEWLIANALQYYTDFIYFDPLTHQKRPDFGTGSFPNLQNFFANFNRDVFSRIIDRIEPQSYRNYNEYSYDVYFKPNTTYDIYNQLNKQTTKLSITIKSVSDSAWKTATTINTRLDEVVNDQGKTIKQLIDNGDTTPSEVIDNFVSLMQQNRDTDGVNLMRWYFSKAYSKNPNANDIISDGTKLTVNGFVADNQPTLTLGGYKIPIPTTQPGLYGYNRLQYGYSPMNDGVFGVRGFNTPLDPGFWDAQEVSRTETSVTMKFVPKIWVNQDGQYVVNSNAGNDKYDHGRYPITQNINPIIIEFLNVVPKLENKTTVLSETTMQALNSSIQPIELFNQIKDQTGEYQSYVEAIKNGYISNLPPRGDYEIILKANQSVWDQKKDEFVRDRYIIVEVWIKGKYFNNSTQPIDTPTEGVKLGDMKITTLAETKVTTLNSRVSLDIKDLVQKKIAPYSLAQNYWLDALDAKKKGDPYYRFTDSFEKYLSNLIFNNPIITSDSWTRLEFSTENIDTNNIFFNNNTGNLHFYNFKAKLTGGFYNNEGIAQDKNVIKEIIIPELEITGFDKVSNEITSAPKGTVQLKGENTDLITFDDRAVKTLFKNEYLQLFPSIERFKPRYDTKGLTDDDYIEISGISKNFANGSLTFDYKVKRVITNQILTVQNKPDTAQVSAQFIADFKDSTYDASKAFLTGRLTIVGFGKIQNPTQIKTVGYVDEQFTKSISSAEMEFYKIQMNQFYGFGENDFIDKLIQSIKANSGILNLAPNTTEKNIKIAISKVNNVDGQISVKVQMDKYFKQINSGSEIIYELYDSPGDFESLQGELPISLFKKIIAETTIKSNSVQVSELIVDGKEITADEVTNEQLQQIVYDNIGEIFNNIPSLIVPEVTDGVAKNNPYLTKQDITVEKISFQKNSVLVNISLNSYFSQSDKYNTICWSKDTENPIPKKFENITLIGFGYKHTTISDKIILTSNDVQLINTLPSDVVVNKEQYESIIRKLVLDRAVKGGIPEGTTINNVLIDNWVSHSNIDGTMVITVSLNKFYDENGLVSSDGATISKTITIEGFRSVRPTIISDRYDGRLDPNINTKFPYEFTQEEIIRVVYDYLIKNPTDTFTIGNIRIKPGSLDYDNLYGTLSFIPILDNYYDDQGEPRNEAKEFNRVSIFGFKEVTSSTEIVGVKTVKGYENALAISFLDYQTSTEIKPTEAFKKFIINNMIINGPSNLTINDIDVSNIIVDNSTGSSRGIVADVKLKKWINDNGTLVQNETLDKTIIIRGFGDFEETTINKILSATIFEGEFSLTKPISDIGAKEFLYDYINKNGGREKLKQIIFNNIQYKWGDESPSMDVNNPMPSTPGDQSFSLSDINIANIEADNLQQTITLDVGFYKYIDKNGKYNVVNIGEKPKIISVTIKGFKYVNSSEIKNTFRINDVSQDLPHYYEKDIEWIRQKVYDNALINKAPKTSKEDLTVKVVRADNREGTLIVNVKWTKNYYDYLGELQTTSGREHEPEKNVIITGFRSIKTPTSVASIANVKNIMETNPELGITPEIINQLPSEVFRQNTSIDGSDNKELIQKMIYSQLKNIPLKKVPGVDGSDAKLEPMIDYSDISIATNIMSDGNPYYGAVDNNPNVSYNGTGSVKINFEIPVYYSDDLNLVDCKSNNNLPKLKLSTIIYGFKANDFPATTLAESIDVNIINVNPEKYESLKLLAPNELVINNNVKELIIDNAIFNWPQTMVEPGQKINYEDAFKYLKVVKKSVQQRSVILGIQIQNYVNSVDGIKSTGVWSQEYDLLLTGFRVIEPTGIRVSINLADELTPNLSNYSSGTSYKDVNVYNVNDQDVKTIIHSQLRNIIENPTPQISNIMKQPSLLLSDFDKYIKVGKITRDGLNGNITVGVKLYSYYNDKGILVENQTSVSDAPTLSANVTFVGFSRVKVTKINSDVYYQDSRSPNEFFETPSKLSFFVEQNKKLFFENLPSNFDFIKSMTIIPISFSNIEGYIEFTISITDYFDSVGTHIYGSGIPLTQKVRLSGLKRTNKTELVSTIDVVKQFGWPNTVDLSEINSPTTLDKIKTDMIRIQNDKNSPNKIFMNIPMKNISSDDFSIAIAPGSINFSTGTVQILVSMDEYYDDNGVLVIDQPKTFAPILLTGFKTITSPTTASASMVSVKGTKLENWTTTDPNLSGSIILENINDDLLRKMLINLPSNATTKNIIKLSIIEDSKDAMNGNLSIQLVVNNYFGLTSNNDIVQKFDNATFTVQLTGFSKISPTKVAQEWDISSTALANKYVPNVTIDELIQALNFEDIKATNLIDPIIDPKTGKILTEIVAKDSSIVSVDRNGPEGYIYLNLRLRNYYKLNNNGSVVVNEGTSGDDEEFRIKVIGFKKLPITEIKEPLNPINGKSEFKASDYASESSRLLDLLKQSKEKIFNDEYGAATINIVKLVNPEIATYDEYQAADPQNVNKVFVNDVAGEIKVRFIYTGGYDVHGDVDVDNERLSPVVTIDQFQKVSTTNWKEGVNVSGPANGIQTIKVDISQLGIQEQEVENWDQSVRPEEIIKNSIIGETNIEFFNKNTKWTIDPKNGLAQIIVSVNGWATSSLNGNLQTPNNKFTSDSVMVTRTTEKNIMVQLVGFTKVNLEKQTTTLWILIGVSSGLLLLILASIIGVLAYKRKFH